MSEAQDKQPEAGKGAEDTPPSADSKNADKGKQQELTVPKARLDEVIAERNALKAEKQAAQDAIQAAEEAKKLEQGKYQELYEKAQADAEKAANELAKLQSDALKRNVATEGGYPGLWDRISKSSKLTWTFLWGHSLHRRLQTLTLALGAEHAQVSSKKNRCLKHVRRSLLPCWVSILLICQTRLSIFKEISYGYCTNDCSQ
jgi:hypothetical protein